MISLFTFEMFHLIFLVKIILVLYMKYLRSSSYRYRKCIFPNRSILRKILMLRKSKIVFTPGRNFSLFSVFLFFTLFLIIKLNSHHTLLKKSVDSNATLPNISNLLYVLVQVLILSLFHYLFVPKWRDSLQLISSIHYWYLYQVPLNLILDLLRIPVHCV